MDLASQSALPDGYILHSYETLDSTNAEALRRLVAGSASHGDVLVAAVQTAGRGRYGRHWQSPAGNLHFTVVVSPPPVRLASQLAFVAGLSVHETLCGLVPRAALSLKWPNDVLCDGKKVAGVLIEGDRGSYAVGIGINLALAPCDRELMYPATSLQAAAGRAPGVERATILLCGLFDRWYGRWLRDGFAVVRQAWMAVAHSVGESITATTGTGRISGRFAGLAPDGALLLDADGRRHHIAAGDVEIC